MKPGPAKKKFTRESANAIAFAELCLVLHQGEYSRPELCEKVGISDSTLRCWMRYLRSRKLVIICEHRRTHMTGACLLIYTWNHHLEGKDAKPPERQSLAETSRNYRARKSVKILKSLPITGETHAHE